MRANSCDYSEYTSGSVLDRNLDSCWVVAMHWMRLPAGVKQQQANIIRVAVGDKADGGNWKDVVLAVSVALADHRLCKTSIAGDALFPLDVAGKIRVAAAFADLRLLFSALD